MLKKLTCDKEGCNRGAPYVKQYCDGIGLKFCNKHAQEHTIKKELPERIKDLKRRIRDAKRQLKCQNSKEGHAYEDISEGTLYMGTSYECMKCHHQYCEPFNFSHIEFKDELLEIS